MNPPVRARDGSCIHGPAGTAGRAISHLLTTPDRTGERVKELLLCDSRGIVWPGRAGNDEVKEELARRMNPKGRRGDLRDALDEADVFIGVSRGGLLDESDIRRMATDPIVFAMANPTPKTDSEAARKAGAAIIGTGRSSFPNEVNNVLVFPGLFRGRTLRPRLALRGPPKKMASASARADPFHPPNSRRRRPAPAGTCGSRGPPEPGARERTGSESCRGIGAKHARTEFRIEVSPPGTRRQRESTGHGSAGRRRR